jgi:hypothetical protein
MKTQYVESLVVEVEFATSLYSRRASFFSSSSVMMINPLEHHGAYGGGVDDLVEWRGRTGDSSIRVSCGPHATEEKSVVPPRRCRVLLNTPRILKPSASSKRLSMMA